ncbi:MAG: hypothetical protein MAG431_01553 [Chloroflexi bacterium]|nr:hypothetical protein [Chloroflexota bacterium]
MTTTIPPKQRRLARSLLHRLERISSDSSWAHRASGIRASLSKAMGEKNASPAQVEDLINIGFHILEKAAQEIPES